MNQTSSGLYIALCLQAIAECEDQTEEGKPTWRFDKTAATQYKLCIKGDIILGFPHLCFVQPKKSLNFPPPHWWCSSKPLLPSSTFQQDENKL
jgi:hypothetical protein